jgi:hypothetical protein
LSKPKLTKSCRSEEEEEEEEDEEESPVLCPFRFNPLEMNPGVH